MERLTKAALATGGAAVLLVSGAGTLALWTDEGLATGTDDTSGTLAVTDGTCGAWTFDGGGAVTEGIVPGDTVVADCALTVGGTGVHLALDDITVSAPTWAETDALTGALEVAVDGATLDGAALTLPLTDPVAVEAASDLVVTVAATFPEASGDHTQALTATLEDVTVQVTQGHLALATP
ncbi:alternate-type signal peptide domain-containing protein [Promicromonospora iranensis]|uniref:Alternate signal-mediated exported protein n=1 Tax=Promicromonospora iranensis TaxID=1105144 RepID=A0ABU2CVJ7_9MICO|nr:alternate-type signal peptide domain-containing protein [Promicromonospora iranensis]MDR7385361.1 alternate signal-mediated exported protein [Promicromonospora iranensis]